MLRLTPHLRGKTHVIWDWNGTLLDDAALCVEIIGAVAERHGVEPLGLDAYLKIFRFPVIEYYRDVGFDLERVAFADLTEQFMSAYLPRARSAPLFAGARQLLTDLGQSGVRSSVLSATREVDLVEILRHHDLGHHFTHICGIGDQFASSKVERGRELVRILDLPSEELVLIGDTDHDLEVGRAMGIDVLLLDGGHQHFEKLEASAAKGQAHHPARCAVVRRLSVSV